LPHAVCRLQRANTFRQPDDDRVSRNVALSGRKADFSPRIRRHTGRVLWRKLLGCALDRIQAAKRRCRAGAAPAGRYQEMGFPDTACISFRLSKAVYRPLFELVWGTDFHTRWPGNTEEICATPGGAARFGGSATPIRLSAEDRTKANRCRGRYEASVHLLRLPISACRSTPGLGR
jgi:hypothetical protein